MALLSNAEHNACVICCAIPQFHFYANNTLHSWCALDLGLSGCFINIKQHHLQASGLRNPTERALEAGGVALPRGGLDGGEDQLRSHQLGAGSPLLLDRRLLKDEVGAISFTTKIAACTGS